MFGNYFKLLLPESLCNFKRIVKWMEGRLEGRLGINFQSSLCFYRQKSFSVFFIDVLNATYLEHIETGQNEFSASS